MEVRKDFFKYYTNESGPINSYISKKKLKYVYLGPHIIANS
jgi:hypothetical protein